MLSKQQLGFLRSLHQKKFRQMYGKFLVEGDKLVRELLQSEFKVDAVYSMEGWHEMLGSEISSIIVTEDELKKISTHENPNQVIAVANIPDLSVSTVQFPLAAALYIACDNLSDPGNAGAIIRIADWFGIKQVFFSESSVDIYNPKVVSAAKGSLFRVKCWYTNLKKMFEENTHLKVYGTFMSGENIYNATLDANAFILIGNEAHGINDELQPHIQRKISIPSFGKAESLNAAVAAGIVVSEFKKRN